MVFFTRWQILLLKASGMLMLRHDLNTLNHCEVVTMLFILRQITRGTWCCYPVHHLHQYRKSMTFLHLSHDLTIGIVWTRWFESAIKCIKNYRRPERTGWKIIVSPSREKKLDDSAFFRTQSYITELRYLTLFAKFAYYIVHVSVMFTCKCTWIVSLQYVYMQLIM